jgi:hypothetical protein
MQVYEIITHSLCLSLSLSLLVSVSISTLEQVVNIIKADLEFKYTTLFKTNKINEN